MIVGVIGAGAWGTALAITAARGGADVVMWSFDGLCGTYDDVVIPCNLHMTRDMADLSAADVWLAVTPSAFFRETMRRAREFYRGAPIIICTKGAECATGDFMSDVLSAEIPECADFAVLAGPQFASEVARGMPTGSTVAGTAAACAACADALRQLYLTFTDDVIGAEYCGVGKNALALICGYNTVAAGENERALIFTRAWGEVVSIAMAAGADIRTFLDLCGIGDLYLTATSPTSRNFSAGMAIARGEAVTGTVEGINALSGLIRRGRELGVETPVLCDMRGRLRI